LSDGNYAIQILNKAVNWQLLNKKI
jgi:hypothetical protein